MTGLNLKIGSRGRNEENRDLQISFLSPMLEELKENNRKNVKETKIVNTNVSREVMKAFALYCVHVNRHRKEIFPLMLQHLLDKYNGEMLYQDSTLNQIPIDFSEKVNGNFEYDTNLVQRVKEFQAENLVKFNVLYEQAIIQYLNDKGLVSEL